MPINILELLVIQYSYVYLGVDLKTGELYKWMDSTRLRHCLIKGKSGVGKTGLIYAIVLFDLLRGNSGVVFDPIGGLADSIIDMLASLYRFLTIKAQSPYPLINRRILSLRDKVFSGIVLLDLTREDCSGFRYNPLEMRDGFTSNQCSGDFMVSFERATGANLSEQLRRQMVIRSAASLVSEAAGTLRDVALLLAMPNSEVESFINTLVKKADAQGKTIELDFVRDYMQLFFTRMPERQRFDLVQSTWNALNVFLGDSKIFRFFSSPKGNLDLYRIMNSGGYLIVKLPDDDKNTLVALGSSLINRLHMLAKKRTAMQKKRPFSFILDEFYLLLSMHLAESFSTIRNFGISWVVAHQSDLQLLDSEGGEQLLEIITQNTSTHVYFQIGTEDAMRATYRLFNPDGHMTKLEYEEITYSHQLSTSRAVAYSIAEAVSKSKSVGKGKTIGISKGVSISFSESEGTSVAEMKGTGITVATGKGYAYCKSENHNMAVTMTENETIVEGVAQSQGNSESNSTSESNSYGDSRGQNQMDGHSYYLTFDAEGKPNSYNSGVSVSNVSSTQRSFGTSVSNAISNMISASRALANGRAKGVSKSKGTGESETISTSESEVLSKTIANSLAVIKSYAKSMSKSISKSVSKSITETETTGRTETRGRTTTETEGESSGTSRTKKTSWYSLDEEARVKSYLLTDLRKREAFVYTGEDGKVTKIRTIDLPFDIETKTGNVDYVEVVRNICRPAPVPETHGTVFERIKDQQLDLMDKKGKKVKGF